RDRTHWNSNNLQPQDPVTLGLCSQIDLDAEVRKASKRVPAEGPVPVAAEAERAGTLLPASQTIPGLGEQPSIEPPAEPEEPDASEEDEDARVFAKLKELTRPSEDSAEETDKAEPKA